MEDRSGAFRLIIAVSLSIVSGVAAFVAAISMMMIVSAKVRSAEPAVPLLVGSPAPYFELDDADGNRISLNDFQGKPAILVFWADWCPDCKAIIPELNQLNGSDMSIVGINLMESRDRIISAIARDGIRYPVLLDRNGDVGRSYGVQAIPNIFVLDAQGRVTEHRYTVPTRDSLEFSQKDSRISD
jgi:peroxiredoxin